MKAGSFRLGLRPFLVAICLLASALASAQDPMAQAKQKAEQQIATLNERWRVSKETVTFGELNAAAPVIWASGDRPLIRRLQNIWISTALREKDVPREIGGRVLALLLQHMIDGPVAPDAVWASVALGQAYLKNAADLREGAHYALMNAIAIGEALERAGKGDEDIAQSRAQAYALLGQSYLQADRPGPANYFLRKAQSLADAAKFTSANRSGLEYLLSLAADGLKAQALTVKSADCPPIALRDKDRVSECIAYADLLWSRGDIEGVERLFANLTSEVRCGSVNPEEMEAFRSLHFARLILHGPESNTLIFTTCGLAGRLNGEGTAAWAAIVSWPLINSHIMRDTYEQQIADVSAHSARRFMRANNDSLAWLSMQATMAYVYSWDKATDKPGDIVKLRRKLMQPSLAFDMAYIADRNDWTALRDFYIKIGNNGASRNDPAQIESILEALSFYFDENYGFKIPTPPAAMELYARTARRLPADNKHHMQSSVIWPRLEQLYRSDDARAAKVAAANLAAYRNLPNADPATIVMLLQAYADASGDADLDKSHAARREALQILAAVPGRDSLRIDLLLEMQRDRNNLGDTVGADRFFNEAVAVRRSAPDLDPRTATLVDMRLASRTFREGDRLAARALAEKAFANLLEATKGPNDGWARSSPAKTLAGILAADGDLARAKSIFETYVFPFTDKAVAAGEAVPIDTRLDLANLEAIYGPTLATVKTIRDLLSAAQRRAASARDIQERAWRALAIAYLGVDDGRSALDAARRAFAAKPAITSQAQDEQADRRLSETFVSAAWRAQTLALNDPR